MLKVYIDTHYGFSVNAERMIQMTIGSYLINTLSGASIEELKALTNDFYSTLCREVHEDNAFGTDGSCEFIVVAVLYNIIERIIVNKDEVGINNKQVEMFKTFNTRLKNGLADVIKGGIGPLQFSNYMDKVLEDETILSTDTWSNCYFIVEKFKWRLTEPYAREKYRNSFLHQIIVPYSKFNLTKELINSSRGDITSRSPYLLTNFYISAYSCPYCGEPLYKTLFSYNQPIVTDHRINNIERIFTCNKCKTFFAVEGNLNKGEFYSLNLSSENYMAVLSAYDKIGRTSR